MSRPVRLLPDPRQPERTALAWRRTTLAALACGALLVGPDPGVIGIVAAVVLVGVVVVVAGVRGTPLRRGATTVPAPALLAAVAAAVVAAALSAAVIAGR